MKQYPSPVHPCVYTSLARVSFGPSSGDSGPHTTLLKLRGAGGISTREAKEPIRDATYSLFQPVKRIQEDPLFRKRLFN